MEEINSGNWFKSREFKEEYRRMQELEHTKILNETLNVGKLNNLLKDIATPVSVVKEDRWLDVFETVENTTYMYKIKEVSFTPRNFLERIVFKVFNPKSFKVKIFSESIKDI